MTVEEQLREALARIAQLEDELASRPAKRAVRAKAAPGPACQYCGDTKSDKQEFLGLPLCRDWRPCASRIRRNTNAGRAVAYAYDPRVKVAQVERDGEWFAWFDGECLGSSRDRGAARRIANRARSQVVVMPEEVAA